jgi:hypothetical protein
MLIPEKDKSYQQERFKNRNLYVQRGVTFQERKIMKTNEELEAEITELREQMYVTRSAQLGLVEAIAMALHLPGTLNKDHFAETIETLATFAKRSPGADDPLNRGMLDFLQGAAQRLRMLNIGELTQNEERLHQ